MKNINETVKSKYLIYILFLAGGLLLGWLLFHNSDTDSHTSQASETGTEVHAPTHGHDLQQNEAGEWTCSMHPQIRQDKPGKCPICAMDLIPVRKSSFSDKAIDPNAIQLSEEAAALADVQTSKVSRQNPVKQVRLYGKIVPDERSLQSQTAHVSGRIESLNVDFTGETVRAGQTLATLYSPELFTAQQELLEAIRMGQSQLIQAAREKLYLWKMTDAQIAAIEKSGSISPVVEIKSNTSGIVLSKRVSQGDYVSQGAILFDVANLTKVWALFDAFEVDLPFLSKGDPVEFTLQALPGKNHPDTAQGAKCTIVIAPLLQGRIPAICTDVTTVTTPGESVDIVVTDYGVAVNPRRPDLLEALKAADCVPLKTIEELRDIAYSIVGEPEKVQFGDRIVGIIEARDGTVMDVVREVKPFSFRED